ncbi:MAG: aryl-sulfate sulfotransferase [Acidimicrobiaceae bacterium]|nr:aryl-sulfate sulfotransferase [Acidimicrobiaceae bacterium]
MTDSTARKLTAKRAAVIAAVVVLLAAVGVSVALVVSSGDSDRSGDSGTEDTSPEEKAISQDDRAEEPVRTDDRDDEASDRAADEADARVDATTVPDEADGGVDAGDETDQSDDAETTEPQSPDDLEESEPAEPAPAEPAPAEPAPARPAPPVSTPCVHSGTVESIPVGFTEGSALRVTTLAGADSASRVLCGPDAARFEIDGAALRWADIVRGTVPDFESPADHDGDNRYEVTVSGPDGLLRLSVLVVDRAEPGTVRLPRSRPVVGEPLVAQLTDPDGGVNEVSWRWERSNGPDSFAAIYGATSAVYVPLAADSGRRLRAVAVYTDRSSGPVQVAAYSTASKVVLGPRLISLSAQVDGGGQLAPAFDPEVLHYKIACGKRDVVTVNATLPPGVQLAVNGVQPRPGIDTETSMNVTDTSDIGLRLSNADGSATDYVVHCVPGVLAGLSTRVSVEAEPVPLLSVVAGRWIAVIDQNGVPRFHRENVPSDASTGFFLRSFGTGAKRQWAHTTTAEGGESPSRVWRILDADFETVRQVGTTTPLTRMGLHDFRVLEDGSALAMTYEPAVRDFSWLSELTADGEPVGAVRFDDPEGRAWGSATETQDSAIQLLDADGAALWNWNSWGRVPLEDCVAHRFPNDYAHLNSLQMTSDGVLVSLRGCSSILMIDHRAPAGDEVVWRIGQTNLEPQDWSERGLGPAPLTVVGDPLGAFCGQHAAALIGGTPDTRLVMFDNGVVCVIDPITGMPLTRPGGDYSRVVEYALDLTNREAVFVRDHSAGGLRSVLGAVGGHVEVLEDGRWLISWGQQNSGGGTDAAVNIVDPWTGAETFTILSSGNPGRLRALPVDIGALDAAPESLRGVFPDAEPVELGPMELEPTAGTQRAIGVPIAFSRPVVDFTAETPSIEVSGGVLIAVEPWVLFGKPANSYLLTIVPDGDEPVVVRFVVDKQCDSGGICSADGFTLSDAPKAWTTPEPVSAA